jgi:hypothetical protein
MAVGTSLPIDLAQRGFVASHFSSTIIIVVLLVSVIASSHRNTKFALYPDVGIPARPWRLSHQ